MGRRPNPIIVKNFNRGSKLTDHSNRYAHTCKHCGSNFPKGRVDNLVTHAVKYCPSINPQARAEALGDYAQQAGANDALNNPATSAPTLNVVAGQQDQISGHGLDALAYAALNDGQAHGQAQGQAQVHYVPDYAMMVGGNGDDYGGEEQDEHGDGAEVEVSAAKRPKLKMATAYTMTTPPPRLDVPRGRGRRGPGSRGGRGSRGVAGSHGQPSSTFNNSYTPHSSYTTNSHPPFEMESGYSKSHSFSHSAQEQQDPPSPNIDPSLQQLEPSIENAAFNVPSGSYYEQGQDQDHFGGREDGLELPDSEFPQIASLRPPDHETSYHVHDHHHATMTSYVEEEELHEEDHYDFGPRPQRVPIYQPHRTAPYEQPFANSGPASYAPRQSRSAPPSLFEADFNGTEHEDNKRSHKQRLRGKFNDARKREVKAVRKLGACLRCRMLKKPCSPGLVCEACEKIEDPRLWHFECTRTRLETAFNHFSSGIHSTSAYANEITPLRNESPFDSAKTIIDATQAVDFPIFLSIQSNHGWPLAHGEREDLNFSSVLPSIEGNGEASHFAALASNSHIVDLATSHDISNAAAPIDLVGSKAQEEIFVLDHESSDIPIMIRSYVQEMLPYFVANEPSDFMHVVLDIAQTKAAQFDHDHPEFESPSAVPKKGQPDDKYNIVRLSLEMWATVKVLLETDLTWNLSKRTANEEIGSGTPILPHEESYRLIVLQLKAAAETKAADLVRQVVGIVERLLLKATSKTHFDLFIVGLLILNTLEKATWLFEKFNRPTYVVAFPLQGDDEGPNAFLDNRRSIVKLMNILLRMRGVPPPTHDDNDGILTTSHDEESRTFYDRIHLSHAYVLNRFQMNLLNEFVVDNSRSYELNLCSWLLLPAEDLPKEAVPKKIATAKKEPKPKKHSY